MGHCVRPHHHPQMASWPSWDLGKMSGHPSAQVVCLWLSITAVPQAARPSQRAGPPASLSPTCAGTVSVTHCHR